MATEHLFHYTIGLLGLMGVGYWLRQLVRVKALPRPSTDLRLVIALFLCIFLPMAASLTDAVNVAHAGKTTLSYVHFLPAALYVCVIGRSAASQALILKCLTGLLALLVVDALVQFFLGQNLLGFPRDSAVLTGLFDDNQRLGLVLALFIPMILYQLHRLRAMGGWQWLLLIPYLLVVLFSLKRSAWVMLIVGAGLYVILFLRVTKLDWRVKLFLPIAALGLVVSTAYFVPSVSERLNTSLGIFSADYETLDIATSRRLTLWRTAGNIIQAHPINGVGPRGYRYAYKQFAEPGDFWINQNGKGQTHPHFMGLEVLSETGVIGLIALLGLFYLVGRTMMAKHRTDPTGAVWLALALVAWFPLNTHLAFYGSYWSSFVWLFIALGVATRGPQQASETAT